MHGAACWNIAFEHMIGTLAALCACHLCTELSIEIWFCPFHSSFIDANEVSMFLQTVRLCHLLPCSLELINRKHVMDYFVEFCPEFDVLCVMWTKIFFCLFQDVPFAPVVSGVWQHFLNC